MVSPVFHLIVWLVCSVGGPESPGNGRLLQGAGGIPLLSEGLQPEQRPPLGTRYRRHIVCVHELW